jgi:hypothetical protein
MAAAEAGLGAMAAAAAAVQAQLDLPSVFRVLPPVPAAQAPVAQSADFRALLAVMARS